MCVDLLYINNQSLNYVFNDTQRENQYLLIRGLFDSEDVYWYLLFILLMGSRNLHVSSFIQKPPLNFESPSLRLLQKVKTTKDLPSVSNHFAKVLYRF